MLSRWLHSLQQFQFSIIHRPGKDHGNADGLSRAPSSPCRQCTWPDCPPATLIFHDSDQPFDSVSTGSSEDADLVPVQSGEDWIARLDDDLSRPVGTSGDSFRISALQREDPVCVTLHDWVLAEEFPAWAEVKSMLPELRSLWHHRNNLSVDDDGTLWRKRSSQSAQLQLLVPKAGREQLFLSYHASLFGGHLGRTRTLARLADRFYWTGMADDVKDWLSQCVACIKRKSPVGRHHPLGHIPTGHRWDRIAMDILDVCDPTPEGFRYILVIADYFSKWTEAFPMKNKCADTVADILVEKIILRFGMPLVIHSDQGREFENGLMKSLCALLGCTKTRTAPYHPESDGMIERFNQVVRQATGHTVGIQRDADKPIIFVHVDDLKLCPGPRDVAWTPGVSTAKSLCASTVAFRPGSDVGDVTPDPSVDVSAWEETSVLHPGSDMIHDLDKPIDLDGHILSPFYPREIIYQNCTFLSIAHLMCYRYAVINNQKTFATGIRKWSRPLRDFPTPKFSTNTEIEQWKTILAEIYEYLCISDSEFRSTLVHSGPRPFTVAVKSPWGPETGTATPQRGLLNDILIDLQVAASHDRLKANTWLGAGGIKVHDTRHARH